MNDGPRALAETEQVPSRVAVVGIYRRRNADLVRAIVEPALAAEWTAAWWALDEADDRLADVTVGVGHGAKLPLLNRIVDVAGLDQAWLVFSDDDVAFTRGNVRELVELCEQAQLDLAQPARSDDNSIHEFNVAHPITLARRFSLARMTTFVEVGPLFVVAPRWREKIVPFPEERAMGWGIELDWHGLHEQGCRLGIVDAIRVAHLGEPGGEYDFGRHVRRMHAELEERGFDGWSAVQRTLGVWRPWQRVPPWSSGPLLGGR